MRQLRTPGAAGEFLDDLDLHAGDQVENVGRLEPLRVERIGRDRAVHQHGRDHHRHRVVRGLARRRVPQLGILDRSFVGRSVGVDAQGRDLAGGNLAAQLLGRVGGKLAPSSRTGYFFRLVWVMPVQPVAAVADKLIFEGLQVELHGQSPKTPIETAERTGHALRRELGREHALARPVGCGAALHIESSPARVW